MDGVLVATSRGAPGPHSLGGTWGGTTTPMRLDAAAPRSLWRQAYAIFDRFARCDTIARIAAAPTPSTHTAAISAEQPDRPLLPHRLHGRHRLRRGDLRGRARSLPPVRRPSPGRDQAAGTPGAAPACHRAACPRTPVRCLPAYPPVSWSWSWDVRSPCGMAWAAVAAACATVGGAQGGRADRRRPAARRRAGRVGGDTASGRCEPVGRAESVGSGRERAGARRRTAPGSGPASSPAPTARP